MPYDKNSPEARWGAAAEGWVDVFRQEEGWWRIPVSNLGPAALCSGPDGSLVALDRLYSLAGSSRWCDIKFKTAPVTFNKLNVQRHGVDLKNWRHYMRVQKLTGISGDLAIVVRKRHGDAHEDDPHLLWATLDHLNACGSEGPATDKFPTGGFWWDLADLPELGPIRIDGTLPPTDRHLHPWERRDRLGKLRLPPNRPRQMDLFGHAPQA